MRTEVIDVDDRFGSEFQGKYIFKELTWAKRNRIIQKYTKYNRRSGQVESSDLVGIQAETIMACLTAQPENKPLTLDKLLGEVEGVPIELGEMLSKTVNRLCNVTQEEAIFLSEQSEGKSQTAPLPTSASAKNSDGPQISSLSNQQEPSNNSS